MTIHVDEVDAILPQTQCGLCGYGGCKPYANALCHENAPINLCPPGGVETLIEIANKLKKDATPFIDDMLTKAKPSRIAIIREEECIGCTKCITACPVDAIIGSAKSMHVVMSDACTGCELCIPPCPVDCIDMVNINEPTKEEKELKRDKYRKLFLRREARQKKALAQEEKSIEIKSTTTTLQSYINNALNRVKNK